MSDQDKNASSTNDSNTNNTECEDIRTISEVLPEYNGDFAKLMDRLDPSLCETIYVRTGPMSSGKTTQLITKCIELELQDVPCIILRSTVDNRSAAGTVQSATGQTKLCYCCTNLMQDTNAFDYIVRNAQVIFIDEAQFFGEELVEFCMKMAHTHRKSVWVYGLNGDSDRQVFGYIYKLMPLWTEHRTLSGYVHLYGFYYSFPLTFLYCL